jgi:uncharacterized membrane protein YkvA (DUF1232 family)
MWGSFFKAVFSGRHKLSPWTWIVTAVAAAYAVWPFDVIPDWLIGFGQLDDLGLWGVFAGMMRWELSRYQAELSDSSVESTATRADGQAA